MSVLCYVVTLVLLNFAFPALAAVGVGVYVWCRFRPVSTRKELLLDSSIMTFPMMQVDSLTAV